MKIKHQHHPSTSTYVKPKYTSLQSEIPLRKEVEKKIAKTPRCRVSDFTHRVANPMRASCRPLRISDAPSVVQSEVSRLYTSPCVYTYSV